MDSRKEVSIKVTLPEKDNIFVCRDCGSEDVEEQTWSSINDYIIINRQTYARVSVESANDIYYCNNCQEECQLDKKE